MGKVALFAMPKVEPKAPWRPTEEDIKRYGCAFAQQLQWSSDFQIEIDNRTRERVAVLSNIMGLTYLTSLSNDDALDEIVKLCERPDVCAVLGGHHKRKVRERQGRHS
jgi:hypothetical protein